MEDGKIVGQHEKWRREKGPSKIELSLCDARKIIHCERKKIEKSNEKEMKKNVNSMLKWLPLLQKCRFVNDEYVSILYVLCGAEPIIFTRKVCHKKCTNSEMGFPSMFQCFHSPCAVQCLACYNDEQANCFEVFTQIFGWKITIGKIHNRYLWQEPKEKWRSEKKQHEITDGIANLQRCWMAAWTCNSSSSCFSAIFAIREILRNFEWCQTNKGISYFQVKLVFLTTRKLKDEKSIFVA